MPQSPMLEASGDKHKYKFFRPPVLNLNNSNDVPDRPASVEPVSGSALSSLGGEAVPPPSPRAALISGLKSATDRRQQQLQQQQQMQQNYTVGAQGQRIWSPFQEYPGIQRVGSPSKTGVPYGGYSGTGYGSGYSSPNRVGSPRSPMLEGASLVSGDPLLDGRTSPSAQMYAHLQAKQRELQMTSMLIAQQQERIQMALSEAILEGQGAGVVPPPGVGQPVSGPKLVPTTLPAHHSQHQWLHEQLLASPMDDSFASGAAGFSHGGGHGFSNTFGTSPSSYGSFGGFGSGRPASPSRIQRPSSANFLAHPTPISAQQQPFPYSQHSYSHSHSNSTSMTALAPGSPVGAGTGILHGGVTGGSHRGGGGGGGCPSEISSSNAPETPFRRGHRKASSLSTNVFTSPKKEGRQSQTRDGDLMFPVRQPNGPPPADELQSHEINFDSQKVAEILRT